MGKHMLKAPCENCSAKLGLVLRQASSHLQLQLSWERQEGGRQACRPQPACVLSFGMSFSCRMLLTSVCSQPVLAHASLPLCVLPAWLLSLALLELLVVIDFQRAAPVLSAQLLARCHKGSNFKVSDSEICSISP